MNRRKFLSRAVAGGAILPIARAVHAAPNFGAPYLVLGGAAANNPNLIAAGAFFPQGSGLSSLSLTGRTNLPGMPNSQSSSVNIAKTLFYDSVPTSPQRLFTSILPDTSFENVTLDLNPPGTQYNLWHSNGTVTQTAFGQVSVYLKVAATAGAAIGFFAPLVGFPLGLWFELLILLNDVTITGAAAVKMFQFFKGQSPNNSNQLVTDIGFPVGQTPPSGGLTLVQFPIFTGYSGGPIQSDITLGINPLTGTGGLADVVVGSVVYSPQAANPNVAIGSAITSNGTIPRFGAGAPNFFAGYTGVSSVALIGEVIPGVPGAGFQENSGDASQIYVNNSYWVSLDTRFGDTNAGIPVEPADTLYYSDPF